MELRKTVQEILEGSPDDRIDKVTKLLNIEGVETADDLKYFDWISLHAFGKLSNMEVNKIMRYIQEKFPDEYKEHKRKMDEWRKIQNETEILKVNVDLEKELQQEKIKLEEEKVKKLKEQQEIEEESRTLQNQHNSKEKVTNTNVFSRAKDFKKFTGKLFGSNDFEKQMNSKDGETQTEEEMMSINEAIAKIFRDSELLANMGMDDVNIKKIKAFVQENFPEDIMMHKKRNYCGAEVPKRPSKWETLAIKQQEQSRMGVKVIDEMISELFELLPQSRVEFLAKALKNHGTVEELKHCLEKPLQDMGLVEAEIAKITDYIYKNELENSSNNTDKSNEESLKKGCYNF